MFGLSRKNKKLKFENEYELLREPIDNADHIPLRLSPKERKVQRLMRGVILASSYTDKVDTQAALKKNRDSIIVREVTNALTGLIVGCDIHKASVLLREKNFAPYQKDICLAIETCRRYKIMNPDMLRTDYVKFLYMIQDAVQSVNLREILGFSVVTGLVTVGNYCRQLHMESILQDPSLPLCITPVPFIKNKDTLNKCLRCKDQTVNELLKNASSEYRLPEDKIEVAVRSLNDANCFSNDNVKTTVELMGLLKKYFDPNVCTSTTDLSISEGESGSRLTHEHRRQYYYVLQSLALWKNICRQIFALWTIAEEDMLNPDEKYELRMTGQGLQRVQKAPRLYKAITQVLEQTKRELGEWVGSERIHLGDDQVPNAFHFIDKYGQVSRILIPILRTITHIEKIETEATYHHHRQYIKEVWGSGEGLVKALLRDFFKHGFDGSGGDNMDDAGSCIDGRLTSAWNWCNNIRHKPFYPFFLMAGFNSFDGDLDI